MSWGIMYDGSHSEDIVSDYIDITTYVDLALLG